MFALLLTSILTATLEPLLPTELRDGLLVAEAAHGQARCTLSNGEWQRLMHEGTVRGWVCTDGETRLGLVVQASARGPMSDADASKLVAGAAHAAPAGQTVTDQGWERVALPSGEAIRVWVTMSGPDGVSVMHSLYLPGEPSLGFVYMSHTDGVTPPPALLAMARSFVRQM